MTPRQAYEADVAAWPLYSDGTHRAAWAGLSDIARYSWERDPRPRPYLNHLAYAGLWAMARNPAPGSFRQQHACALASMIMALEANP